MILNNHQMRCLLDKMPRFELSYETISHKKVSTEHDVCFAIPTGKKVFVWFTFYQKRDVCYILECNRDKKIVQAIQLEGSSCLPLSYGTLLYGTLVSSEDGERQKIILDEIYYLEGNSWKHRSLQDKLSCWRYIFESLLPQTSWGHMFAFPVIWSVSFTDTMHTYPSILPDDKKFGYPVHHLQYRSSYTVMPYLNIYIYKNKNVVMLPSQKKDKLPLLAQYDTTPYICHFKKPQYRYRAVFRVYADIQFDIYHLFACGKDNSKVYYNMAYIPNYKTSVMMNSLFRKIRENRNLDYIEESDDEDDFENIAEDKYVNLYKNLLMECEFHPKFKRWVPLKTVHPKSRIIHIMKL